ncbi:protein winged eye-like isoform X4 [Aedes aegypti]|uniref:Uncharacterized protein n=1 Tax=Aedes aegypti TaxID=7159 RepID=A0A6I8TJC9_AEDAE|nr:protein winged eye-like isoform X4 [Aedes aegypti]
MLGPTANGRLMGPGTIGSSGSAHHRNLWPSAAAAAIAASSTSGSSRSFEFQTSNGEVTESLFAAGGYNTPPASSPFLSCSPLELVAKNFHSTGAAVTFSQANSSIFVQSQTDFINGTTSVAKKTETCIGRWEHGTLEPLQIQIKREPCQVSEVTTSNNFEASSSSTTTALTAVVKLEAPSPKAVPANIGTAMDHIGITSTQNNAAATIPVGIAVARQRLQDSTGGVGGPLSSQLHQAKELNRFGIAATGSTADLGCTTPSLSQNMFFTGTNSTMIPLSSEAVTMGVTNAAAAAAAAAVQNAVRTPPALWQYPGCQQPAQGPQPVLPQLALVGSAPGTGLPDKKVVGYLVLDRIVPTPPEDDPSMKKAPVPMESMLPMPPMPPVGFQLVRDPTTGQILFLPTTTTIDKVYISCIEPFPQTVVWPSYPQSTAAIQPPHLLLPQIPQQQLQPPPLAPLQMLSSDYLATASSTTLHQQQHTQTHHSTRYVALTSDGNKRTSSNKSTASNMSMPCQPTIPMPIPSHTFIKIEDCSGSAASSCNNSTQIFHEQEKTIQTSTIGTSPDIAPQLLFQQGNLIQITPSTKTTATLLEPPAIMPAIETAVPNPITPPPIHSICFDSSESPSARTPSSHMSNSSA